MGSRIDSWDLLKLKEQPSRQLQRDLELQEESPGKGAVEQQMNTLELFHPGERRVKLGGEAPSPKMKTNGSGQRVPRSKLAY